MKKRKLLRQKAARGQSRPKETNRKREIKRLLDLATRALGSQRPREADDCCRRILILDPKNAAALNLRGLAAAHLGNRHSAEDLIRQALSAEPDNPAFNCNLGILLANVGNSGEALQHFERALQSQPDNVEVLYNLIELYEKSNQLPKALAKTRQALALRPDSPPLHYQLAKLEYRQDNCSRAREIVTDLLDRKLDQELSQKVWHLLGQACDRLGEYEQAFAAVQRAKQLAARTPQSINLEPQRQQIVNFLKSQYPGFSRDRIASWQQPAAPEEQERPPVFLIGFPRSGTTLAGQILAAHSQVATLDERQTLMWLIEDFLSPERLEQLAGLPLETIVSSRARYRQLVQDLAGPTAQGRFIVDKNPLYICYLALIARFFPEAKVIVIHRDPRDVCISNFMQDFALTPFMQNFLTMEHTVAFYDTVMNLFQYLRDNLSLDLLEMRYELLVDDFRGATDKMLSFLGLTWEDGISSFQAQAEKRLIKTPSYQQVIKPIYSSSRGRWENYAAQLAPFMERLRPHIEILGYTA